MIPADTVEGETTGGDSDGDEGEMELVNASRPGRC